MRLVHKRAVFHRAKAIVEQDRAERAWELARANFLTLTNAPEVVANAAWTTTKVARAWFVATHTNLMWFAPDRRRDQ